MLKKRLGGSLASRFSTGLDYRKLLTAVKPEKALTRTLPKRSGRDQAGKITSRHQGGREKRQYRLIDFKRDNFGIVGKVVSVEYDPNRTANIALINFADGQKRYILHPEGLQIGDGIVSGQDVENKVGNSLPLGKLPIGT